MKMKRTYQIQLIIDIIIILFGLINYLIPTIINNNAVKFFYIEMVIYGVLELLEYFLDRTSKEPLLIFISSFISALTLLLVKSSNNHTILSISIALFMVLIVIVKAYYLGKLKEDLTYIFYARLTEMSIITLICLLTSINLYFKLSSIALMLSFLYLGYGMLELGCDFLTYLMTKPLKVKE